MTFVNVHTIFSFAAGNPNRDDTGTPKSVSYGGRTRSRISSQAMTRAKRVSFEADTPGETTSRSTKNSVRVAQLAVEHLERASGEELSAEVRVEVARRAGVAVDSLVMDSKKAEARGEALGKSVAEGEEAPELSKDTLTWLGEGEVRKAAAALASKFGTGVVTPDEVIEAGRTESLSIAAFGRMFAKRPDLQNEAAVQRGHAFTTHASELEIDYFSAVDDLRLAESGDSGAGHLGMTSLTGGVYYWHANVDSRQLLRTWSGATADDAASRVTNLFSSLFEALPRGRRSTSAHAGLPAAVLVVESDAPTSLQTAFERAIDSRAGSLGASVDALLAEAAANRRARPSRFGEQLLAVASTAAETPAAVEHGLVSLEELASRAAAMVLR